MFKMIGKILKDQRGQTIGEYVFMIGGAIALAGIAFYAIKIGFVGDITQGSAPTTDSIVGKILNDVKSLMDGIVSGGSGTEG